MTLKLQMATLALMLKIRWIQDRLTKGDNDQKPRKMWNKSTGNDTA